MIEKTPDSAREKYSLSKDVLGKEIFTTGGIARICEVAPRTVANWFDAGRLRGYRVPGSTGRRIPRESFIAFLKENDMPFERKLEQKAAVVVCGEGETYDGVCHALESSGVMVRRAEESLFNVGLECVEENVCCVVMCRELESQTRKAIDGTLTRRDVRFLNGAGMSVDQIVSEMTLLLADKAQSNL